MHHAKQFHFSYSRFKCFLLCVLYTHINITHFSASSFLPVSYESAKACAVVVENDSSSSKSSQILSTKNNAITNLNGVHNSGNPQMRTNVDFSKQGSSSPSTYLSQVPSNGNYQGMQQQEPRNLPPDGTTFNQISLGKRLQQTLPPYGYWNMQFYQVRSLDEWTKIELNYSLIVFIYFYY